MCFLHIKMQKTHCHSVIGHTLKNRRSTFTPLLKFLPQGENSHRLKKIQHRYNDKQRRRNMPV